MECNGWWDKGNPCGFCYWGSEDVGLRKEPDVQTVTPLTQSCSWPHVMVCLWNVPFCVSVESYQDQGGEQGEEYETEEQLQARILTAALEFVPQHGWSVEAIAAAAEVSCCWNEMRSSCRANTANSLSTKWPRQAVYMYICKILLDPSHTVCLCVCVWVGCCCWCCCCFVGTRHWACPLLPLVCSITELETWSYTSSPSATHSWQRFWLNNTTRSSWARPSTYIYTHTCCLILLLKCEFTFYSLTSGVSRKKAFCFFTHNYLKLVICCFYKL